MKVICISGKAQHGKDTTAAMIKECLEGQGKKVLVTHYADLLKYICRTFFGWDGNKDEKGRHILQYVGTDVIRQKAPNYWVDMIAGRFGSGKTYLMCAAALELLEKGKFEKIVYVRNNVEVKNSKPIGHLPGSYNEKLLPFAMPLADHLGGTDALEIMLSQGKVEIVHLGFIRGRDIKNSIIMCSEVENMTKEHIQLLIGRVGEGSALWLDGDVKQVDAEVFQENSGMQIALDKLKGHPRFGYVKLLKTERSETAAMADLLD